VHWVRPESKSRRITVGQIREFERRVNLRAGQGRLKVVIIEEADCLTEEAGNAFLKTLEEPPAQTMMLLLSAEPQRLLPTILSRCLTVSLGVEAGVARPEREWVAALLRGFFDRGDHRTVAGIYRLHAALGDRLQQLRDDVRRRLEAEANEDRYRELDPEIAERLNRELAARVEGQYRAGRERLLEELYAWFGDVLLCAEGAESRLLNHPAEEPLLRRVAADVTAAGALAQLEALDQIAEAWQRNVSDALALEVGLLKLLRGSGA
jgi:DNA polymerase-3 subunit delta'